MSAQAPLATVIDLASRRAPESVPQRRRARTLIVGMHLVAGETELYRHVGVDDSMSFTELHTVIDVCLGFDRENPPWAFYDGLDRITPNACVHEYLSREADTVEYEWGLWRIVVEVVDIIVRDKGTPRALCVGGAGTLWKEEFDPSLINAKLTGDAVIERTLRQVSSAVADVIRRSGMYDFIALLQALDISRPSTEEAPALPVVPVEHSPRGRDAFFAMLLSFSCMSDEELTGTICCAVMEALGWGELSMEEIRIACADSLAVLASLGVYGAQRLSAVDRIDIYRELLRHAV